jgi:hypothetical protein
MSDSLKRAHLLLLQCKHGLGARAQALCVASERLALPQLLRPQRLVVARALVVGKHTRLLLLLLPGEKRDLVSKLRRGEAALREARLCGRADHRGTRLERGERGVNALGAREDEECRNLSRVGAGGEERRWSRGRVEYGRWWCGGRGSSRAGWAEGK